MSFTIQCCSPADADGLAATMMGARLTDPHWVNLWDNITPEAIIANAAERIPQNLLSQRETKRHQKAVEHETGRVVGYARWCLPPSLADTGDVWLDAQVAEVTAAELTAFEKRHRATTQNGEPVGLKGGEMMSYRSTPLEVADARITSKEQFLVLEYLATDPAFWRRGIGSMLVQSGLEIADQYRISTYVMSEPAAFKLYRNLGFDLIDTVSLEYSEYGGVEPEVHYFFVRKSAQ